MITPASIRLILMLSCALLACNCCNKPAGTAKPVAGGQTAGTPSPEAGQPADAPTAASTPTGPGYGVYMASGCKACHGEDLTGGGNLGPALKGLSVNWSAETLTTYMKDPQGVAATNPRLAANKGKYSMLMPALPIKEPDMVQLVEFLLEQ